MRKLAGLGCVTIFGGLLIPKLAAANPLQIQGTIVSASNVWNADSLQVTLNTSAVDNGCGGVGSYGTDPSQPSNHLLQSMLLSAYIAGKPVTLVLYGCMGSTNTIIQVRYGG